MSLKLSLDHMLANDEQAVFKLHLGCGANILPGWINTDASPAPLADYLDSTRSFPFADGCMTAVFCEHMIEHMEKSQARRLIGETHRVLRPGGTFRVVTPSIDSFARMALDPGSAPAQQYLAFFRRHFAQPDAHLSDVINTLFYGHGHRHIYQVDELAGMLRDAGFVDLRTMAAGTYGEAIFDGVDGHGKVVGEAINAIEAFAIEARK